MRVNVSGFVFVHMCVKCVCNVCVCVCVCSLAHEKNYVTKLLRILTAVAESEH